MEKPDGERATHSAAIGAEIVKQFETGKIKINKLILEQPHLLPKAGLEKLFAQYEGREITAEELIQLQSRLSRYYFAAGYVNSGVIIPNQTITDGVIRLKAIHGRLTRIKTKGNHRISNNYIRSAVAKGVSVPLNTFELQQALAALKRNPLIADIKANITPGEELGQSTLRLEIKEKTPYFFSTNVSNHQSPSIGQYRFGINFGNNDLFGQRDSLQLNLGLSEGLKDSSISYAFPIGDEGIHLDAYYSYNHFNVIDAKYSAADITSVSTASGLSITYPLIRKTAFELTSDIGFDIKHMTLTMFGQPGNFVDGIKDGETSSTPIIFNLNSIIRNSRFVSAISAGIRRGSNFGIYAHEDDSSIFTIATGQLYLGFKPTLKTEWIFRINGQLSKDSLGPVEKFAIGGSKSVRGYRENLLVRDSGIVASSQLRLPLYRRKVYVVPFVDYGRSWERENGLLGKDAEQIYSAGTGLQWHLNKAAYAELFWGKTLKNLDTIVEQTQDNSFHFLIDYKFY